MPLRYEVERAIRYLVRHGNSFTHMLRGKVLTGDADGFAGGFYRTCLGKAMSCEMAGLSVSNILHMNTGLYLLGTNVNKAA